MNISKPVVSISMISYNHEKYIAKAIESVVCQETDFEYQLVIGEDCSSDATRAKCEEYQRKFPDKIRLLDSDRNYGMMPNALRVLAACNGEYIAHLEGDDYWTDPKKLQKQVDYLKKNKDIAAVAHNVHELTGNEFSEPEIFVKEIKRIKLNETGFSTPCNTCSLLHRNVITNWPSFLAISPIGDWPIMSLVMTRGDLVILPEVMGVYRKNTGMWSTQDRVVQITGIIKAIDLMLFSGEFESFKPFREHLTQTKINYIREAALATKNDKIPQYSGEANIIEFYQDKIAELNSIFSDGSKLSARVSIPTMVKTLKTKLSRGIKK